MALEANSVLLTELLKELLMEQYSVRKRVILVGILLFAVVTTMAYLQSIYHFNTYLALTLCLADTIVCARLLFMR